MERKELVVLPQVFQHLAAFNYNKAKDLAEKERNSAGSVTGNSTVWPHFLNCLSKFAAVEKLYMSLNLLTTKGFLRRENSVRVAYEELLTELTDLETRASGGSVAVPGNRSLTIGGALGALGSIGAVTRALPPSHSDETVINDSSYDNIDDRLSLFHEDDAASGAPAVRGVNTLLLSLCSQMLCFVRARICCVRFYESCYRSLSSPNIMDYNDLALTVADIVTTYADNLTQPLLKALQANLKHECDALHSALLCLCCTQQHKFMPALRHLDAVHEALSAWQRKDGKKSSFSSSFLKGSTVPQLFEWLFNLRAAVTAKFSLYFFNSLSVDATPTEIKATLSKQAVDHITKIISFHRKAEATCVCLVLESSGIDEYRGPGYHYMQCCEYPPLPNSAAHSLDSSYPVPPSPTLHHNTFQTFTIPSSTPPSPTVHHQHSLSSSRKHSTASSTKIPPPPPPPAPALSGIGYTHRTFERIFCWPIPSCQSTVEEAQSAVCWTSLLSFLPKRTDQLPVPRDGVTQVYHHQTGYTHYLLTVEPLVTAVVSYDCHRTEKESVPVRMFLNDLSQQLNLVNLFSALKPK